MNVRDLMTRDVRTCAPSDSAHRAARLMAAFGVGTLVVLDGEAVLAVVTDRDVALSAYRRNARLRDIPVREIMSRELYICAPDEDIRSCQSRMREHGVNRLPVVENGRLLGIVSVSDLAHGMVGSTRIEAARELIGTLNAITRARTLRAASGGF